MLTAVALVPWLVAMYWHILLIRRILVVSKSLYPIPENVYWMDRARLVKATDTESQALVTKRNGAAFVFVFVLLIEFIILLSML